MIAENKDKFYLAHILEAIDKIEQLTATISKKDFLQDWKVQDATVGIWKS